MFATLGVIAVYLLGLIGFKDEKRAFLSGLILLSCGLYVGLARTVFTDMIFSVFISLSLLSFFWGYSPEKKKGIGLVLFFIFSGLAVLTKGPLGFLIPFLTIFLFLLIKKDIRFLKSKYFSSGLFIFVFISLPWYIFIINRYGNNFIHEFFFNGHIRRIFEAEHISHDTWYFYLFSMIGCMFPWSLFVIAALFSLPKYLRHNKDSIYTFLICWVAVVFLIFQSAHSKLVSYIFPFFPTFALLASDFIYNKVSVNNYGRLLFLILLGTLLSLLLIPLGLSIGLIKYPVYISSYLSSKIPIYYLMIVFLTLIASMLFFILRNKLLKSIYTLVLVIPVILSIIPFIRNDIEPYLSSKKACEYLLNNYNLNNMILCSRPFVRGVRYYTDREVAVIDIPGKPFFSPHPISFLNSDHKVRDFLDSQSITYCILKKSSLDDIERIIDKAFKFTILKVTGNEYVLKIERLS